MADRGMRSAGVSERTITEQLLAVVEKVDRPTLERITRLLLDGVAYIDEHNPEGDEQYCLYPCSGRAEYHLCSFTSRHSEQCERGLATPHPSERDPDYASPPCPVPCEEGPPLPWCNVSGTDCPDCAIVVELRRLVAAVPT